MYAMIRGGFMPNGLQHGPPIIAPHSPIYGGGQLALDLPGELVQAMEQIQRGAFDGDMNAVYAQVFEQLQQIRRTVTSTMTGFPVRENLEAPARVLIPMDTPMRNRIPRVPGAGTASAWRQLTSFGGGYGVSTTVTSGASSATQTVGSTAGMQSGDGIYFATTNVVGIVSSVTNATTVVLTASISTTTAEVVSRVGQPGQGAAVRSFYAETGAPASHTETYAAKSAGYKLLGTYGDITGFAMASGATYQNQYATTKRNSINNLMLNEENAIVNGSSSILAAPWGDGSTNFSFDGIRNLTTTANGVPTNQVQTSVGALTFAHIDLQISRIWNQGGRKNWMLLNEQEARSIDHLFDASGSTNRVVFTDPGNVTAGRRVTGYVHPITKEVVDIIVDRFMPPGEIIFGSDLLPDMTPALDISVLPQVMLPELAPDEQIQGYTAQELAPTTSAPQVYPFVVTVYEVLRMLGATVFAKSQGVTGV